MCIRDRYNDGYVNGNTAGNLYNEGYFCEKDGIVYFANPADNYCLYSMNPDGKMCIRDRIYIVFKIAVHKCSLRLTQIFECIHHNDPMLVHKRHKRTVIGLSLIHISVSHMALSCSGYHLGFLPLFRSYELRLG